MTAQASEEAYSDLLEITIPSSAIVASLSKHMRILRTIYIYVIIHESTCSLVTPPPTQPSSPTPCRCFDQAIGHPSRIFEFGIQVPSCSNGTWRMASTIAFAWVCFYYFLLSSHGAVKLRVVLCVDYWLHQSVHIPVRLFAVHNNLHHVVAIGLKDSMAFHAYFSLVVRKQF